MNKSPSDEPKPRPASLVEKLRSSGIFRDYQDAFEHATGLPLTLRGAGESSNELGRRPNGNPFCLMMAKSNQACASCYALQQRLEQEAKLEPRSLHCFAGLCESAVPIRVGDKLIAFLQTGQILLHRPDAKQFKPITRQLIEWGTQVDLKKAEEAWFSTTVLTEEQYESMVRLLHIFSKHLAECGSALQLATQAEQPDTIKKAKVIVNANLDNEVSLAEVAKAVNVSAGYFSELFHKTTGLTFTEYVARVRVEKVKNLLANPRLQITTIAYDTGFKSLSQFNRVFKRVAGMSPREFREQRSGSTVTG